MISPRPGSLNPARVALTLLFVVSVTSASLALGQEGASGIGSKGPMMPSSWHTMEATWAGVDAELLEGRLDQLRDSLYSGSTRDAHAAILLGLHVGELDGAASDLDLWLELEPTSMPARFLNGCVLALSDATSDLIVGETALQSARALFEETWVAPFDSAAAFNAAWTASQLGNAAPARALAANLQNSPSAWLPEIRERIFEAVAWGVPARSGPWQTEFARARHNGDRDRQRALARRAPLQLAYLLHSRLESTPRAELDVAVAYVDSVQAELAWSNSRLAYARRHVEELRALDFQSYLGVDDVRRRQDEAQERFRLGAYEQAAAILLPALQRPVPVGYTMDLARQTYLQAVVRLERFPEAHSMLKWMSNDVRDRPDPVTSYYYWDLYIWMGRLSGRSQMVLDGTAGMQRLCDQTGIVMDNLMGGIADLESQLENPAGADRMWQEVYRRARRSQDHDLALDVLMNLAYLAHDQDNDERAAALLRMFLARFSQAHGDKAELNDRQKQKIERSRLLAALLQDRSPSSGLSTASTVADSLESAGSTPAAVEAHLLIAREELQHHRPRKALDHAEQAHRLALDKDVQHFTWRALATKAEALHTMGELEQAVIAYATALDDIQRTNATVSDDAIRARRFLSVRKAVDGYVDVLIDLERTQAAFAVDEQDRMWRRKADGTTSVDPVRDLQKVMPSGEAVVKYRVQPSGIHAWWVTRKKTDYAWIEAPRTELIRLTRAVRRELDGTDTVRRTELFDLLLGQFAHELDSVRILCFVEDDVLVRVPFAMLGQEPLVQRHTVIHAPTAGARRLQLAHAERNRRGILAVGHNGGPNPPDGLPVLAFAEKEARRVGGIDANTLIGNSATVTNIRDHSVRASILHFACHAGFDALGNPFLVLAGEDGLPTKIYDYDMADWSLAGDLVVLSACETAIKRLPGPQTEGPSGELGGLVSAFFDLSAKAVLATLWSVEDSDVFMRKFYENLTSSSSAAETLRRTQVHFLTKNTTPTLSKLQLGAYRCYGE